MTAKDAIRQSIGMSDMIMAKYLDDLDDVALMKRPVAGMNHIAWQLGHLITSEYKVVDAIKPGSCPPLPEGFYAGHDKEAAKKDDAASFRTKDEYLALWTAQREASKALLETLSDAELDAPAPEHLRAMCPTVGHAINLLVGLHPMMHVGQFVAVRRELQKPIAF